MIYPFESEKATKKYDADKKLLVKKAKARTKALEKKKEGNRYTPAHMPSNYQHMSPSERSEYYKNHKGHMVSDEVDKKTGKYKNTY